MIQIYSVSCTRDKFFEWDPYALLYRVGRKTLWEMCYSDFDNLFGADPYFYRKWITNKIDREHVSWHLIII